MKVKAIEGKQTAPPWCSLSAAGRLEVRSNMVDQNSSLDHTARTVHSTAAVLKVTWSGWASAVLSTPQHPQELHEETVIVHRWAQGRAEWWKAIQCSWIGKLHSVKMSSFPANILYRCSPNQNLSKVGCENWQKDYKVGKEKPKAKPSKTTPKKNKGENSHLIWSNSQDSAALANNSAYRVVASHGESTNRLTQSRKACQWRRNILSKTDAGIHKNVKTIIKNKLGMNPDVHIFHKN